MTTLERLRRCALALAVAIACGCAAAPARAPSAAPVGPAPTTIDEAVADVERWRAVIEGDSARAKASGGTETPAAQGAAQPVAPSPTPAPAAPPADTPAAEESTSRDADGEVSRQEALAAECETPCKAIASMRRSVEALCRLAGAGDARCVDARAVLARSEARVARCGC